MLSSIRIVLAMVSLLSNRTMTKMACAATPGKPKPKSMTSPSPPQCTVLGKLSYNGELK